MKKMLFLVAFTCVGHLSYSQLRMAVLGGPHSASVKEENSIPMWESQIKPRYSQRGGLNLGILTEIPLSSSGTSGFFLQPGILYMSKGRKFFMRNDTATSILTDTISASHNLAVNYIEVPFNLTYKIPLSRKARFILSAGPYFSFFYNGKQSFETRVYSSNSFEMAEKNLESGNAEDKIKTFDAGLNARAGFEIGNVFLTGFMSQGLTSFYTASYDGSFKHNVKGVSLGIWLSKPKQSAKPAKVAKDTDKDGIPDSADACPTVAGILLTHGCPDGDDDGIADDKDKCPAIPGTAKYEGCPVPDSDGDGMNDEADACPTQAGVVEFNGCPIPDMDGDGLNDLEDKCPAESGPKNNNGCPVKKDTVQKEVVQQVNFAAKNIFFKANSDKLSDASLQPLDEIAQLLHKHSDYRMVIEGHTDSTGRRESNMILSQKRAESVKNYLIGKGVESSRLSAIGYGPDKPLEPNATPEGRARNRRVELKLDR